MKKSSCFVFLILLFWNTSFAQQETTGTWEGSLAVSGIELDMILKIDLAEENYIVLFSVPVQGLKDLEVENLYLKKDSIYFDIPQVPGEANYSAQIREEKMTGTFSQAGQTFPLEFYKFSQQDEEALQTKLAVFRNLVDSLLIKRKNPGIGIGIIKNGKTILSEGFGYKDYESKSAVTDQTLFAIGSCSKAFTACDLAFMVDDGLIEWEEPVRNYMPDFRLYDEFATTEMTPLDLVCHRSGLPRHDLLWYASDYTRRELYSKLRYLEPNESFRAKWQYQNLMFLTAGILVEQISDQSWEGFTKSKIFDPLGMTSSNFTVDKFESSPDFAYGYKVNNQDSIEKMPYKNIDEIGPAGSINSNVNDMLKWIKFQLDAGKVNGVELLSKNQFDFMHQNHMIVDNNSTYQELSPNGYGTGWFVAYYNGHKWIRHGGNIDGFSAQVVLLPEDDIGMVFLSNKNRSVLPSVLALEAIDLLLEDDQVDWVERILKEEDDENKEDEMTEEENDKMAKPEIRPSSEYIGKYTHPAYGTINIDSALTGDLQLTFHSLSEDLEYKHFDIFSMHIDAFETDMKIQFQDDINGHIVSCNIPLEGAIDPIRFEKLPPEQNPSNWAPFVGKYQVNSLEIEIKIEDDKLYMAPTGQPTLELIPINNNEFKPKDLNGYSFEFVWDNDMVNKIVLNQPNGVFEANKIE